MTDNTAEALNKVLGDSALVQLKDDDDTTAEAKPELAQADADAAPLAEVTQKAYFDVEIGGEK